MRVTGGLRLGHPISIRRTDSVEREPEKIATKNLPKPANRKKRAALLLVLERVADVCLYYAAAIECIEAVTSARSSTIPPRFIRKSAVGNMRTVQKKRQPGPRKEGTCMSVYNQLPLVNGVALWQRREN